ncbi:MAG TPA: magnesium transporter [Gemmatimonadaceae bacterium]|nr:magnesium transporter [Gemmatimonadaceae bacterium]
MDAPTKTPTPAASAGAIKLTPTTADQIAADVARMGPREAARLLSDMSDAEALDILQRVNPAFVADILPEMSEGRRAKLFLAGPASVTQQWTLNQTFPENTVGRLMEPPTAIFGPTDTVAYASSRVKELVKKIFVTYCFVCDEEGRLVGIVTMRDLLVSDPHQTLADVMLKNPFYLRPDTALMDAMKLVLNRHYPIYPMCDSTGKLVGLVRGQAMFEEQAYEISAQAGSMVGIQKEERLVTPWPISLRFRHPWLQLNLLTAFIAAAVVGFFQGTLDKLVILALFLPVLAGQSGNTGCQALAVTLRGMTLGELKPGTARPLVAKEALLGLLNGALVGLVAAAGMYWTATRQNNPAALQLAAIVVIAMIGACIISSIMGAVIPLTLKRFGLDPATASAIFLTTATDVSSMGIFLLLATMWLT